MIMVIIQKIAIADHLNNKNFISSLLYRSSRKYALKSCYERSELIEILRLTYPNEPTRTVRLVVKYYINEFDDMKLSAI